MQKNEYRRKYKPVCEQYQFCLLSKVSVSEKEIVYDPIIKSSNGMNMQEQAKINMI